MVNKQLLNLLKNEDWDEARRVLDGAVRDASEAVGSDDGGGSAATAAEERLREVVEAEDSSGQIPLHIAIWKKAPDDLILSLMDARESTVTARTKNRSTPLHFATFYSSSAVVVEALLRRYPLALDEMNEYQVTPRTYDLGKLDEDARELLMRPTAHWIEAFVRDSLEERVKLNREVRDRDGRITALERRLAEVETDASSSSGVERRRRGDGGDADAEAGDGTDEATPPERLAQQPLDELRANLAEAERENEILRRRCGRCRCECARGGDDETNNGGVDEEHIIPNDDGGRTSSSTDDVAPDEKSSPLQAPQFRRRRVLAGASCTTTTISSSSSSSSTTSASAPPQQSSDANANATLERRIEYLEERLSEAIGALDRKISLANNGNGNGNGVDAFIDDGGWVITNASAAAAV